VFDPAFDDDGLRLSQFDEAVWNDTLTDMALDGARENPGYVLTTIQRNFGTYFEIAPQDNEWAEENDGRNADFRSATLPLFYVVTLIGLAGIAVSLRDPRLWPLALAVAQFAVLSLLLVAPPRLRAPFDVMCCIGVGLLVAWYQKRGSRDAAGEGTLPASSLDGAAVASAPGGSRREPLVVRVGAVAEPDAARDDVAPVGSRPG
jgi:hypothetical protein